MLNTTEAARALRGIPSEKRVEASRENGKRGGRPPKLLEEIFCTCGGKGLDHKSTCPRGRTIRQRRKKGQPLT